MTYREWNDLIARHYLNNNHRELPVVFYASKEKIISIAREGNANLLNFENNECSEFETDDELIENQIWSNFLNAVRLASGYGVAPNLTIFEKAKYLYEKWRPESGEIEIRNKNKVISINCEFPPYLLYLVLFSMAISDQSADGNRNQYLGRVNTYLRNLLTVNRDQVPSQNAVNNWNELWLSLANWCNKIKNGQLGLLELPDPPEPKYIGYIWSQAILSREQIEKLPSLFNSLNWAQNEQLDNNKIIEACLGGQGKTLLGISDNLATRIYNNDLIKGNFISIIREELANGWNFEIDNDNPGQVNLANGTIFLYFNLSPASRNIKAYINMPLLNDEIENCNWSCNIANIRIDNLNEKVSRLATGKSQKFEFNFFEANRAVFQNENTGHRLFYSLSNFRLFKSDLTPFGYEEASIRGNTFHLNEKGVLLINQQFKNEIEPQFTDWYNSFSANDIEEIQNIQNIPEDWKSYKFQNPTRDFSEIGLRFNYSIKIELNELNPVIKANSIIKGIIPLRLSIAGLQKDLLPYLSYSHESNVKRVKLEYDDDINLWACPEDELPPSNTEFIIAIYNADKDIVHESRKYKLVANTLSYDLKYSGRNRYGDLDLTNPFKIPENSIPNDGLKNDPYEAASLGDLMDDNNDKLIYYLSSLGTTSKQNYILNANKIINGLNNDNLLEDQSIVFYDFCGHLDYDLLNKKISMLKPRFIRVQNNNDKKFRFILVGSRSKELILALSEQDGKNGIFIKRIKQEVSNSALYLPDVILVEITNQKGEAIDKLCKLVDQLRRQLNIDIDADNIESPLASRMLLFLDHGADYCKYLKNRHFASVPAESIYQVFDTNPNSKTFLNFRRYFPGKENELINDGKNHLYTRRPSLRNQRNGGYYFKTIDGNFYPADKFYGMYESLANHKKYCIENNLFRNK